MNGWREQKLGEFLTVHHGYAFKSKYFTELAPHIVVTPGNFHDQGGFKRISGKEKFYSGPVENRFVLKPNDLIVAMTEQAEGLLGSAAFVPKDAIYLHNQRIGLIEFDPKQVDRGYLYFVFNWHGVRAQVRATATGSKVRHTSPTNIGSVVIALPPLPIQKRIAGILSAYDDLIAVNERRVAILEEMARRVFLESMSALATEKVPLKKVAQVDRGKSYRSADLLGDGKPFVNLKCVDRDGGFRSSGLKSYSGTFKESHVVNNRDIVVAVTDMTQDRRIVAQAARIGGLKGPGVASMDLVIVRPVYTKQRSFLYALLRWTEFASSLKEHANGANVLHLSPKLIDEYELNYPGENGASAISRQMDDMFELQDCLQRQNTNLRATRDLLLPRLISGEIDVSEAPLPETVAAE